MPKAKGTIASQIGGRFVATFIINEIQYIFAGSYNPNPGTYRVKKATLDYDTKDQLTGSRVLDGVVGISRVKLNIKNGPEAFGDLPDDNFLDPASTINGAGTWTTA
jgi:hypothetical protein